MLRLLARFAVVISTLLGSSLNGIAVAAPHAEGEPVVFVAKDYGFTGPESIPAGVITMQVVNKGKDLHHIQLVQLLQGKTAQDFHAAMASGASGFPDWVKFVGGPNAVLPGSNGTATMTLAEGEYVLICIIPDSKGVLHVALGMSKPLSVKGASKAVVSEPKADMTITLADFTFSPSRSITPGPHMIEVMNRGGQRHELVLVKLNPGATAKDFGAAFEPGASGPPPGIPLGGVVGLESGGRAFFKAKFAPGNYGLICFFPDPATGKPHYMHGMTADFVVK